MMCEAKEARFLVAAAVMDFEEEAVGFLKSAIFNVLN